MLDLVRVLNVPSHRFSWVLVYDHVLVGLRQYCFPLHRESIAAGGRAGLDGQAGASGEAPRTPRRSPRLDRSSNPDEPGPSALKSRKTLDM